MKRKTAGRRTVCTFNVSKKKKVGKRYEYISSDGSIKYEIIPLGDSLIKGNNDRNLQ